MTCETWNRTTGSRRKRSKTLWSTWIMNDFTFTEQGFSDYLYWQMQDKKTLKKIVSPNLFSSVILYLQRLFPDR
ncbi:MAG TPA: type II toxin-antitoxin system YoeB family toxin [Candidatus Limivivens intestinipullorum]|uniref:Type II toxin-antitoxin system YoeB family toxin n=1 Tax=Candidatus Limivivens intestinipullorum TaxID=2840858 RepID=A0A9D1ETB6_9FIRM|nr:type II toxin-antitoxin system YoeB family toxin [Candidatus Limivivens intestinipullorum]